MRSVSEEKRKLRKIILASRRSLESNVLADESLSISEHITSWSNYLKSNIVMAFAPMADEPQTISIIKHALASNKTVCLPYVGEKHGIMSAALINDLSELVVGQYGILTPDISKTSFLNPSDIDLIITPGVAFDFQGKRLGMGAGFYDRFLPRANNAVLIGLALSCQIVADIPCEKHDFLVDYLATKDGIINCRTSKM
ncbi:5-formyltetrahydrofolate cyclo-ligase [Dendrosporobacter sp. 1207_IL3150]|uniref:5-formyltetrahydrofolate cyclo-ligase n=1 Tax=Dendrosporobacter sp. 1207_IL3150 TaxID=3084054 RepID=UPI002FDA2AB6